MNVDEEIARQIISASDAMEGAGARRAGRLAMTTGIDKKTVG